MGFHVVAGAGGASYGDLPSVGNGLQSGIDLASFVLDRVNQNVFQNSGTDPGYGFNELQYDFSSEGFAFTPGILGGFSYKVNEVMSFGVGARYVINRLVATGYLRDVQVSDDGQTFMSPGDYLQNILDNEPNLSNSLRPLVSSYIQIMDTLLGDREIDVVQTAQGFTPVLSLNLTFNDRLNASIKYEHRTKMTYKINVREGKDGGMVYSEGNDSLRCNLPGFLQLGLSYKWTDRFRTNFGYRMLFDQGVDWNGREEYINKNYYEVGIGWEVLVGKKYKGSVSGGYTWNKPSVSGEYQNEVDYRLPGHTFCIGGTFVFSDFVKLNTGLMFPYFLPERVTEYKGSNGDVFDNSSYYEKNAIVFGIGLDMALGKARNESTPVIEE
jgi:long-subunit fatty acid transport protein